MGSLLRVHSQRWGLVVEADFESQQVARIPSGTESVSSGSLATTDCWCGLHVPRVDVAVRMLEPGLNNVEFDDSVRERPEKVRDR